MEYFQSLSLVFETVRAGRLLRNPSERKTIENIGLVLMKNNKKKKKNEKKKKKKKKKRDSPAKDLYIVGRRGGRAAPD